jgi:hypothetical protein
MTNYGPHSVGAGGNPRPLAPSNLLTEATKVWGRYRRGDITYLQLESELKILEWGDLVDEAWDHYKDATDV